MKTLRILAISLTVIVVAFFLTNIGLALKEKVEADATFGRFAEAVRIGEYQHAYQFADPQFRSVTSADAFETQFEGLRTELGSLHNVRKVASSAQRFGFSGPWHATETADFVFERGIVRLTFVMERESSDWLIRGYRRTNRDRDK